MVCFCMRRDEMICLMCIASALAMSLYKAIRAFPKSQEVALIPLLWASPQVQESCFDASVKPSSKGQEVALIPLLWVKSGCTKIV